MPDLYQDRAELYDIVYQWKDYAADARRVATILADAGVAPGSRVLEAACGTGAYLGPLQADFDVAGFDIAESMLEVARKKLPGVPLWQADMVEVGSDDLDGPYDAVLCLFSSIGYIWPEARLRRAMANLAAQLRPGGVVLIEPWLTEADYQVGRPNLQTAGLPDNDTTPAELLLARGGVAALEERDGLQISVQELHYLVLPAGGSAEYFVERHELWLCPPEILRSAMEAAGLSVQTILDGLMPKRGLLLGKLA